MEGSERTKLGRRALLAAGAAGVAAAAVRAVAAPAGVAAADHDALKIGVTNTSSKETALDAPSSGGLRVVSVPGDGIQGASQASGKSGVLGYHAHASGNAIWGHNTASGARGGLGSGSRGVYGLCPSKEGAGVRGDNTHPDGSAVFGYNSAHQLAGALGMGSLSTALYGSAPFDAEHWALVVDGRAAFSRSGLLTVAKNKSSVSAAPVGVITTSTTVLATLQTNRAGVYIQAAVASSASGKITIFLNKKVTAATKVAYFILN